MLGVLHALKHAEVEYVLIGELAEVLCGSPLLPVTGRLEIVPRAGQRERLTAAIAAAGGKPAAEPAATVAIDAPSRFTLETTGTELVVHPLRPAPVVMTTCGATPPQSPSTRTSTCRSRRWSTSSA